MKKFTFYFAVIIGVVAAWCLPAPVFAQPAFPALPLIISEVQTGGPDSPIIEGLMPSAQEFIELYNPNDVPYPLEGIRLEYLSATHDGSGAPTRVIAHLTGEVAPQSFYLVGPSGYLEAADTLFLNSPDSPAGLLARSGGHIRLVAADSTTLDLLAWGSGVSIGQWPRVAAIPPGESVQRLLPGDPEYGTGRIYSPSSVHMTPASGLRSFPPPAESEPPVNQCTGIILSELLPNAEGADTGNEFIEVYNATDAAVSLSGCTLKVGGQSFALPDEQLSPRGYRAFTDTETGIVLPNATAIPVTLITALGEETIIYADNLTEGHSWALIDANWSSTPLPTPGQANLRPEALQSDNSKKETAAQPCTPGKERNPETNRCRTVIATLPSANSCKPGQERNPVTNRCRSAAVIAGATLTPCKSGQARSPETNRCRNSTTAAAAAKPCGPGQERNPATNRCRKTAMTTKDMAQVHDVASVSIANNYRWWMIGFIILAAIVYAAYEWRHDLMNVLTRHKMGPGGTNKRSRRLFW